MVGAECGASWPVRVLESRDGLGRVALGDLG
jgi:hypothetical protein